jgi:hypothetical protein
MGQRHRYLESVRESVILEAKLQEVSSLLFQEFILLLGERLLRLRRYGYGLFLIGLSQGVETDVWIPQLEV